MKHALQACLALVLLNSVTAASAGTPEPVGALLDKGQILLRNYYELKDGRKSSGASAFLIQRDGKVRAITAKHLLGPAMGIDPAVKPMDFDRTMKYWVFFVPTDDNPVAAVSGIVDPDDNTAIDFIELSVRPLDHPDPDPSLHVLEIAKASPKVGDRLSLVGCPYAENDCVQNIYPGSVASVSDNRITMKLDDNGFSLAGFSGAPVLDRRGEVVGVLKNRHNGLVTLQRLR
jgi:hypothetical protein